MVCPIGVELALEVGSIALELAVTAGAVLAGIIGAVVATPVVAVAAAALRYWRFERGAQSESGTEEAPSMA